MSSGALGLTWKRARAGKTDLLMLLKIADLSNDEGRDCFAEIPYLAKASRQSRRAAQNTLLRLETDREVDIDYNDEGREITLRGGRRFRPKWFIHVRCVCDWEAYQVDEESAEAAHSVRRLRPGRPKRKRAEAAHSGPREMRSFRRGNAQLSTEKCAETRSGDLKEGSLTDLLVEEEQVEQEAAPPIPRPKPERSDDDDPNYRVVLKTAHDAIEIEGETASFADLKDAVKSLCRIRDLSVGGNGELVSRAIESALWQREHMRRAR